jgi:hypothetical protein
MDPQYGPPIWTTNMDLQYGPQYGPPLLTPNMGPQYRPPIWTPTNMDRKYGPPLWTSPMDPLKTVKYRTSKKWSLSPSDSLFPATQNDEFLFQLPILKVCLLLN